MKTINQLYATRKAQGLAVDEVVSLSAQIYRNPRIGPVVTGAIRYRSLNMRRETQYNAVAFKAMFSRLDVADFHLEVYRFYNKRKPDNGASDCAKALLQRDDVVFLLFNDEIMHSDLMETVPVPEDVHLWEGGDVGEYFEEDIDRVVEDLTYPYAIEDECTDLHEDWKQLLV